MLFDNVLARLAIASRIGVLLLVIYAVIDLNVMDRTMAECFKLDYANGNSRNWFRRSCTDFVNGVRTEVPIEQARQHGPAYLTEGAR